MRITKLHAGLAAVCLSAAMLVAGCGDSDKAEAEGEQVKLQLGHAMSEGTPAADLIEEMAKNVEEQTDGRVKFDVFPNSQLGSETEMLEQVQMGTMESAAIMVGTMQSLDMKMAIEDLPYMWKDIDHARAAYDGEFGEYLAGVMEEQDLKQIGYLEWGYRHITNNKKPIVKPEDMKGLKIRVAESSLRIDAFEQLGALPTSMAFSEVYGALQQGVLDAQENPLANIVAPKFDEVQDYLSLTGHFYNTVMLVVNNGAWDKISLEDQEIVLKEAERISKEVREKNDEMQEEYLKTLEERGMEINDDVDTSAFRDAMLPVYDKWEEKHFGQELMDIYREASGW
ncbi:TRAP transporter substrate-binding protein [Edaphobacillus lindanitolerans]|uniref:Tripartite ATP-independent transporter solute receptor, DctP family n=1 Tax=Edaphobacillus lindanitolerans TaxID=550447 RepID=A0A1U7PLH3_9BACI|nr:DctP family TRAP transporter solute-binding subunit [Edaphobacillus lindanitolerans]SIT74029.1 tripartite ATP-independent transporter solute receptor, DctP family [Edaphobacillus lindanitolerans]